MKRNRMLALVLALALLLALTGCAAKTESSAAQTEPTQEASPEAAGQPIDDPLPEDAAEPEAEPEAQPEAEAPITDEGPAVAVEPVPETQPVDVSIAALKGPTGMGMVYLLDAASGGETAAEAPVDNYTITVSGDPSDVVSKVIAGEFDIACLPTNSAATVYQKTGGQVQLIALNTLGVLHILQSTADGSEPITDWEGLRGQTIYATGQGANPEYILNYLLEANGLVPGTDVNVEFVGTHDELVAKCAAGEVKFCMIPEPNATVVQTQMPEFVRVLDLNAAWEATGSTLVMGCVVVQTAFAQAHPEAVARFLTAYEASIDWVQENPEPASQLLEQYEIVPKQAIALKALPNCALTFVSGADMEPMLSGYLQVLFDANPASVGGSLPDAGFYYAG